MTNWTRKNLRSVSNSWPSNIDAYNKVKIFNMDDDRNRQLDLGSLTLYDSNPLSDKALSGQELNDALINRTGGNIYYMLSQMINMLKIHKEEQERLPEEQQLHDFSKSQYSLRLPPTNTVFPRSRKIPKKKEMTKW